MLICCVSLLRLEGNVPVVAYAGAVEPERQTKTARIEPSGVPQTAFADSELRLRFVCHDDEVVPWQASAARRPFSSGVVVPKQGWGDIRLQTPSVKNGIGLPIQVAVGDALCKVLVLGKDPLEGRRQWADQIQIVLFDPSGRTAKAFDEIELPYRQSTGLGGLAAVAKGMIVVGEGIPLGEHPGLDRILCQVARQGVPVILLRPKSGDFAISDPGPLRFELRRGDVRQRIDSRTAGDLRQVIGFRVTGERNGPVLRITEQPSDYAWGDFRFDDGRGRLCWVTWNLLDQWETSPAPRFFFVRLLEIVSGGKDLPGGKTNE
jgi:hypothetical protein